MSGPEVIETASGVEEFDSRDRALVWRTTGGKHRYLLGDCQAIVGDSVAEFRQAAIDAIAACRAQPTALSLPELEQEQAMLGERIELRLWRVLGHRLEREGARDLVLEVRKRGLRGYYGHLFEKPRVMIRLAKPSA